MRRSGFLRVSALILFCVCFQACLLSDHKPRLLSWDDYQKKTLEGPYVLELKGEEGGLLYCGILHSKNVSDQQMTDIENQWNRFSPSVAFCEGGVWPLVQDKNSAIRLHGEQGLVRHLADRDGVPVRSLDAPLKHQAMVLTARYSPDQIKVYYVLLNALMQRRSGEKLRDLRFVDEALSLAARIPYLKGMPRDREEFEKLVRHYFPELKDWTRIPSTYLHDPRQGRFLAMIHETLSEFRDLNMLRTLVSEVRKGERVFAVVGRSHVVIQEPALRSEIPEPGS